MMLVILKMTTMLAYYYTQLQIVYRLKSVCNTINPDLKDSYFLVNIDRKRKYLHKSIAIWYLTDQKHKLSQDRMNRVMDN